MTVSSIEFYSGIGGMHYALRDASPNSCVLAACDINTTANSIYAYNFPKTSLLQNNIQALTVEKLDKLHADLWMMSPPCQPFTRKGLQRGISDHRCDSLVILLEKLKQMKKPPSYIFLENVVGFETTSVHDAVITTLHELRYGTKEYILSPLQFGVPNSRPRYYLLASILFPSTGCAEEISTHLERRDSEELEEMSNFVDESLRTISLFLDIGVLQRYGRALDIILPDSSRSACFTKSYGSYISGCGSYFCLRPDLVKENRLSDAAMSDPDSLIGAVRRLSPREVANLMCFPKDFVVPPNISDKQMYQCLGNSVNVRVVSALLALLLRGQ
ncbi:C-5 cytosine-specific DNA methylase [Necator americanus]|uniref:tRNA (cytosine(38)-C(5))-methyltransferase n=1 Tax=Necator americanus TaxID=51031 RepID=W2TH40_NECAM|nr:C-5 cytosine-specific DNA methylase [Necator americanus]ETN81365.1 C-5 cytosine-specific DNA methylase [Necator americanus]